MIDMMEAVVAASRRRAFNPLSLSPALWLSDTGSNPAQWDDVSGNGRHATQATPANQPSIIGNSLNGRQVRRFDGGDTLNVPTPAISTTSELMTVFAVVKATTQNATRRIFTIASSSASDNIAQFFIRFNASNKLESFGRGNASQSIIATTSENADQNSWHIVSGRFNDTAGKVEIARNGNSFAINTLSGGFAANAFTRMQIGAITDSINTSQQITGDIAEILVFPTALSTADRQKVEAYLAAKWFGVDDPEAGAYIAAVEAADGQALEPATRIAINNFVKGCKTDGIWDAIKASCILAGARTLAGCLVPLKGAAPTNFNFVAGDYNRKTGLKGDGSTKRLDSNRNNNSDPQNSFSMGVHITEADTVTGTAAMGSATGNTGDSSLSAFSGASRNRNADQQNSGASGVSGYFGTSRSSATTYTQRRGQNNVSIANNSQTPNNRNISVFGLNSSPHVNTDARMSFYHIGESLDLAALDSRVSTLMSDLATAIP